ncbi:rRNA methyltransferase 1, mitochondrial [Antechinus flavipes]|uniref:rRNA methyltransferase 1, mitochondrial n=1 Tax=Antechinus flavipes TaxID=38775 RepID=UPI0022354D94|nr:rRNA methyltransferase 1, mitochondrial [Antechinus flavipes]
MGQGFRSPHQPSRWRCGNKPQAELDGSVYAAPSVHGLGYTGAELESRSRGCECTELVPAAFRQPRGFCGNSPGQRLPNSRCLGREPGLLVPPTCPVSSGRIPRVGRERLLSRLHRRSDCRREASVRDMLQWPARLWAPVRRASAFLPARLLSRKNSFPRTPPWKAGPRPEARPGGAELLRLREDDLPLPGRQEVLFGLAPCALALRAARRDVTRLLLLKGGAGSGARDKLARAAEALGVPVQPRRRRELDTLCGGQVHQGVCMEVAPLLPTAYQKDEEAWPAEGPAARRLWLILDEIQDPRNLGAVLRTAHFLGVDKVITSQINSCPLTPVVSKASAGVMEVMDIFATDDLPGLLKDKAQQGWLVAGTVGCPGSGIVQCSNVPITSCREFLWDRSTLLVLGNEGFGLSHDVRSLCHILLTIQPGRELIPEVESLNVSVAAGILLYSIISQRKGHGDWLQKETSAVACDSPQSSTSSEKPEPGTSQGLGL